MITAQPEELTEAKDRTVRDFMQKSEAEVLIKIVESRAKQLECEALLEWHQHNEGNSKLAACNGTLLNARRYHHFVEVWNEILQTKGRLSIVKLT